MLTLRKTRRAIAMTAAALALAGGATVATGGTANAAWRETGDWQWFSWN